MKTEKLQRLKKLNESFQKKAQTYRVIWDKATEREISKIYYEKMQRYDGLYSRIHTLFHLLQYPHTISKPKDSWFACSDYKYKLEKKAKNKQSFHNKRMYQPWFLRLSLTDDYGTYTCDKCSRTFYHSPSTITQAAKDIYNCCCGHCTNQLIVQDWNQEPYH